jgi:hypothetical protein
MYGNTLTRSVNAFRHMLLEPRHAARWVGDRVTRRSPLELGLPWLSWPSIEYLRRELRPGMRVFEWGGGGSTIFFLRLGCTVTTVESNPLWRDRLLLAVSREDFRIRDRSDLRFVPAETGERENVIAYIDAVRAGAPWDVILVDGIDEPFLNRINCLRIAPQALSVTGLIILDDAWRDLYADAAHILHGYIRREFWGLGPCRLGVTKTDVYETSLRSPPDPR